MDQVGFFFIQRIRQLPGHFHGVHGFLHLIYYGIKFSLRIVIHFSGYALLGLVGAELGRRGLEQAVVDLADLPVQADARQAEGVARLRERDPAVADERLLGDNEDLGLHRLTPERFREILASGDRTQLGATAPAQGLCLETVFYDEGELKGRIAELEGE